MNDKKKDGIDGETVIKVTPRRRMVTHKGLHGWVEYKPSTKTYEWTFKAQFTIPHHGTARTEAEAELEMKKFMDASATSKNIRSVD